MPASAAGPLQNSQLILLGTPPGPNTHGDVFPRTRKGALGESAEGTSWLEWSVDEVGDVFEESRWEETNPALGYRLTRKAIEKELKTMSPDGFARERLGWWAADIANACFKVSDWDKLAATFTDDEIAEQEEWKRALGVKFSADGASASIAIAIWKQGETPHVEVIESDSTAFGITWAVDIAAKMWRKVSLIAVDGKSNAQTFINDLKDEGVGKTAVLLTGAAHVITASSMFVNAVGSGEITHNNQPALNDAIAAAQKRKIGADGGYGFKSANETDVTPLEASALALWAVKTSKRNPNRKLRIG